MKKNYSKKVKEHPDDQVRELAGDLNVASALALVSDSEGGQILLESLIADISTAITELSSNYATLTLQEFVSYGARIKEKVNMARVLANAKSNQDFLKQALKDALGD